MNPYREPGPIKYEYKIIYAELANDKFQNNINDEGKEGFKLIEFVVGPNGRYAIMERTS